MSSKMIRSFVVAALLGSSVELVLSFRLWGGLTAPLWGIERLCVLGPENCKPSVVVTSALVLLLGGLSWRFSRQWLVGAFSVSYLCFFAFSNSRGKINHSLNVWAFAMVLMLVSIFLYGLRSRFSDRSFISTLQSYLAASYFSAGLWKLKAAVQSGGLQYFEDTAKGSIALAVAQGSSPWIAQVSLSGMEGWLGFVMFLVISFQLSCFLPLLVPRLKKGWAILMVLFHLVVGVSLNIWFVGQAIAALYFFWYCEWWYARNERDLNATDSELRHP